MSIRGKVAAATVVAGVVLLLPGCSSTPAAPTSDQIKASAQARLDASVEDGRYWRANLRAMGQTPGEETCQAAWDNKLPKERKGMDLSMWMTGCRDAPQ
ncbi:hypothetical protein [Streptomyces sp. NPDC026673]|uniref:hypothetical protein n=1 Tax=Streptomyces sp. NPDC026673 TaxID=3155724 RepID=UPI00340F7E42